MAVLLGILACGQGSEDSSGGSSVGGSDGTDSGEAGGGGDADASTEGGGGGTASGGTSAASGGGSLNLDCDTSAPNACGTPGARCENNVLIGCALDTEGCLVESERDCGEDLCDHLRELPTCSPPGGQTGDSCEQKQFLSNPARITGDVFENDFSDRQEFSGASCATATVSAPEAVFVIDVPAGETLSVSEVSDLFSEEIGIDAVFGIMAGCSDNTACIATGGNNDRGGISYTAPDDESVAIWVSGNSALDGPYDIRIEIPESLGPLGEVDDLPAITGGPLSESEWDTYVVHTEASGVFGGNIAGDASVAIYDELGNQMLGSNTLPHFARLAAAGTYRVVVSAVADISDYEFELSTRAAADLGSFAAGDSMEDEHPSIVEGDRRYYTFELTESAVLTLTVTSTSGDPDIWLFSTEGAFLELGADVGGSDTVVSDALEPGTYLFDVLAFDGSGAIDSHTLELDFAAP